MDSTRTYIYRINKGNKEFDYFSVFDNNLINNTYIYLWDRKKISVMENHLLQEKRRLSLEEDDEDDEEVLISDEDNASIQDRHWFNGKFLSLKKIVSEPQYTGQFLLLDFSKTGIRLKYVEDIIKLPEKYDIVYFYQLGKIVSDELKLEFANAGVIIKQISQYLFSAQLKDDGRETLFTEKDDINLIINKGLTKLIFNEVHQRRKKIEYIYSSNVYSNHYINMRQVFANSDISMLVTTRLLHMMMETKDLEFDAFICASITGACIASYLSVYIKKPVLFLRNIGPDIKTEDDLIVERIYPHKKYVYIFDFMCLGTEYLRTKLICALKKSSIVKGFGISYYKKPDREKTENSDDIQALFYINEFVKNYYKCAVDKDEL